MLPFIEMWMNKGERGYTGEFKMEAVHTHSSLTRYWGFIENSG